MSDEYPPTTQGEVTPDVEALHMIIGLGNFEATGGTGSNTYDLALRIVDSDWLEAHDREVAEKAWAEGHAAGATDGITDTWDSVNPYREGASE